MQSITMDVRHYTVHPRNGHGVIIQLVFEKGASWCQVIPDIVKMGFYDSVLLKVALLFWSREMKMILVLQCWKRRIYLLYIYSIPPELSLALLILSFSEMFICSQSLFSRINFLLFCYRFCALHHNFLDFWISLFHCFLLHYMSWKRSGENYVRVTVKNG